MRSVRVVCEQQFSVRVVGEQQFSVRVVCEQQVSVRVVSEQLTVCGGSRGACRAVWLGVLDGRAQRGATQVVHTPAVT